MAKKRKGQGKRADAEAVPKTATDIPETRPHLAAVADEPPERPSAVSLEEHLSFVDDGPFAARLRKLDNGVGVAEQAILAALIATIVLTAAIVALADKIADVHLGHKDEIMRAGTFAIAMFGAAFASHQQRHLAMDMVSRRLSARGRLFLRVAIAIVIVVIVALLVRTGLALRANEVAADANQGSSDALISSGTIAALIPVGGVLVIFHTLVHAVIDVDYLRRGKTPPEQQRSAH